jgi:ABC-type phosphate/phosphonate transport system substrate-binding protein
VRPLHLVTYLGDNTVAITEGLARHLSAAGFESVVHPAATWQARHEAILTGAPDIYWMCGLLTVELIDSGALTAEIVAAPLFDGQRGPLYHSVIVSTAPTPSIDGLAGRRLVINETGSWSGNHALRSGRVITRLAPRLGSRVGRA